MLGPSSSRSIVASSDRKVTWSSTIRASFVFFRHFSPPEIPKKKTACLELVFVASKAQTLGQPMATAASPPPGVPSLRDTHRHVKDFKHSGLRETAVRWLALRRIRTCMKKVAVQKFLWKSDVKEASFRNRSQGAHIKHLVQQKSCPQVWHLSCIQADGGQFCLLNSDIDCCRCCGCRSVSHVSLCLACCSFQFLRSSAPPQHVDALK